MKKLKFLLLKIYIIMEISTKERECHEKQDGSVAESKRTCKQDDA